MAGRIKQYHQDVCILIQGVCDRGVSPQFFINGLWPLSGSREYYITYSQNSSTYSFCFSNISSNIILTEYCHEYHSAGCFLCSVDSGEIYFLSHTNIFAPVQGKPMHVL